MVGVPKSTGCRICRQRRIKVRWLGHRVTGRLRLTLILSQCDEKRPSCSQCLAARWSCPGPASKWHWREENSKLVDWHRRTPRTTDEIGHVTGDKELQNLPGVIVLEFPVASNQTMASQIRVLNGIPPSPPLSGSERLRTKYVSLLDHPIVAAKLGYLPFQPYLLHVPQRLGRSQALDDAITCVCVATNEYLMTLNNTSSNQARVWYDRALQDVQHALSRPKLARSSELLAAIMVLQWFERRFNDTGNQIQHARGAERLIEWRGPKSFVSDLDGALLKTQLSSMIFHAITDLQRPCFIAHGEWPEALRNLETGNSGTGRILTPAGQEIISICADMPTLINDYVQWQALSSNISQKSATSTQLTQTEQILHAQEIDLPARIIQHYLQLYRWLGSHASSRPALRSSQATLTTNLKASEPLNLSATQHKAEQGLSPHPFHWAFEIAGATFLLMLSFIVDELQTCLSIGTPVASTFCTRSSSRLPPTSVLVKDAQNYVDVVRRSSGLLITTYSTGASVMSAAMAKMWKKLVQRHDGSYIENEITAIVGDLYESRG